MSEWHPLVVKLGKIGKHPNADTLEISNIYGGYTVIFKQGRFKEGDLAAYIPADSVVSDHPEFDFLNGKKRIKPMKLRGIFSLGILVEAPPGMQEGDSVVEYYGLKKYVYEEEAHDVIEKHRGDHKSPPKEWNIPYYDLFSVRQYPNLIKNEEEVILFEKIEGCVNFSTKIDTLEEGMLTIEEIVKNRKNVHVKSFNEFTREIEYNKILGYSELPSNNDWYELETVDGKKLQITGDHLVYLPELDCYREVNKLSNDDFILFE